MKHFISLATLLISTQITFAQTEKINLSDYKLPEMKRHRLDFFFQTSGENSSSYFITNDFNQDTLTHKTDLFTGKYNLGYSYYRNSPKIQSSVYARSLGNFSKIKQNRTNYYPQDYSDLDNYLSFDYDIKYFFSHSNWFVTSVPHYSLSYYSRNYNDENTDSKSIYTRATVGFGGGKGRIEQVQDFRHAILLIEELEKRSVSKRNVSETEMIELSTLISQLKNKRFFDSRKQKEAELVALDSFFVDKGIVEEKSIQYFTGLEDIWSYGGSQLRESGKQVLFSITPGYNFDKNLEEEENNINEYFLMKYNLSYVSKNPISVKWQGDYDFGLNHEYMKRLRQRNKNLEEKSYYSSIFARGEIGFFPNTRTYFTLNSNIALINSSDEKVLDKENYSAGLEIITSAYYYISEKLRVGYNISFRNSKNGIFNNNIENTYYKSFNYNVTLNYAIF